MLRKKKNQPAPDAPITQDAAATMLGVGLNDLASFTDGISPVVRRTRHVGLPVKALCRMEGDLARLRADLRFHLFTPSSTPYAEWFNSAPLGATYVGQEFEPYALGLISEADAERITGIPFATRNAVSVKVQPWAHFRRVDVYTLTRAQLELLAAGTGPNSLAAHLIHLRRKVRDAGAVSGQSELAAKVNRGTEECDATRGRFFFASAR